MSKEITITIDKQLVDKYNTYYFTQHPKARKNPIDKPIYPSINKWTILPRMSMNNLKQKWTEFGKWIIDYYGYKDLKIDKCDLEVIITFPTKTRRDIDNYCTKLIMDGFVKEGFLVDDSYFHIQSVLFNGRYEKDVEKMEFRFGNYEK